MYACISVFTYINMSITRGLQKVPDALMLFLGFTLGVFTSQSCVIRYVLMIFSSGHGFDTSMCPEC